MRAQAIVYDDTFSPADRLERIKDAVRALASLTREPQERLDRALSNFKQAFHGEPPPGPVLARFRQVYVAIGDPPYGTPFSADLSSLSPRERETLADALVDLLVLIVRETPADAGAPA